MSWIITGTQKENFDPSLIPTALWLDAADSSTVTLVSGGVSEWRDKSGNNRHATQTTVSQRPTYATQLNGKNVLTFSNSNTSNLTVVPFSGYMGLFIVYSDSSTAQFTTPVGTVYSTLGDTGSRGGAYHGHADGSQIFSSQYTRSETLNGSNFRNGVNIGNGLTTPRPTTPAVFSYVAATAFPSTQNVTRIGSDNLVGTRSITGIIAEVIMLDYAPTGMLVEQITGYFAHKWGLTGDLPTGYPYKASPPVP